MSAEDSQPDTPGPNADRPVDACNDPDQAETDQETFPTKHAPCSGTEQLLQEIIERLDRREAVVRALGEELERHRSGQSTREIDRILVGVARLGESIVRRTEHERSESSGECTPARFATVLASIVAEVQVFLGNLGLSEFREPSDQYNSHRQVAVETTPTTDKSIDRKISRRLHPGWERDGRMLHREQVSVYVFRTAP